MLSWLGRGSSAVADQGLFAGANFLLNVLLARWLAPDGYGAFSIAFSVFLLVATLHTALLVEPMLIFGSGKYFERLPEYLDAVVRLHWRAAAGIAVVLGICAGAADVLSGRELSLTMLSLAAAAPFILLTWLARRACYISLKPTDAAIGGLAYLMAMLAALALLQAASALTAFSAVLAMWGASMAALTVLVPRLGLSISGDRAKSFPSSIEPEVASEHWDYGRWAVGTSLLAWAPSNIFVLALPLSGGLEASAAFRALMNLLMPMMQAASALSILILPLLVRRARQAGGEYGGLVLRLSVAFGLAATVYGVVVLLIGEPVLVWLYGGAYVEHAPSLMLMASVPIFASVVGVVSSALRAVEHPELVFRAYLAPTALALTVGMLLTLVYGVAGAAAGWLLTYASAVVALGVAFGFWERRARRGTPT